MKYLHWQSIVAKMTVAKVL